MTFEELQRRVAQLEGRETVCLEVIKGLQENILQTALTGGRLLDIFEPVIARLMKVEATIVNNSSEIKEIKTWIKSHEKNIGHY